MPKPTRTILALAAGSLALGLVGGGAAVADQGPAAQGAARYHAPGDGRDDYDDPSYDEDGHHKHRYSLGKVVSRGPLSVRSKPTTHSHLQYKVYPHETLALKCKTRGENVAGNDLWYLIDPGDDDRGDDWSDGSDGEGRKKARGTRARDGYDNDWVSARYVKDLKPVRWCRD
ncbi:hypothetical protein [Streptomyces sp. NPDC096033]|uniref:hypothetical protein n=1 Tax=Streptomyces sp. NPDC096033 TaxID=3366071 RepID=UPI000A90F527|nr:hypothetical protein [Streptomyces polychromogenes]